MLRLPRAGVGRHRHVKVWIDVSFSFIFFARTPQGTAKKYKKKRKKNITKSYDILRKVRGIKDQPRDQRTGDYMYVWTRELSSSTREKHHGASRSDPHETRVSRVNRNVAGRVESGRVNMFSNLAGRVGSTIFSIIAGRVGSGQEVFKHSRVRADRAKTSQNFRRLSRVM